MEKDQKWILTMDGDKPVEWQLVLKAPPAPPPSDRLLQPVGEEMTYRHFRLMTSEDGHTLYWNSETKAGIAAQGVAGFVVENDDGSFCVAVRHTEATEAR